MANITLSVNEEAIKKSVGVAVDNNTTLTAMARGFLQSVAESNVVKKGKRLNSCGGRRVSHLETGRPLMSARVILGFTDRVRRRARGLPDHPLRGKPVIRQTVIASIITTVAWALSVQGVSHGQSLAEEGKIYWTEAKDLGWIQRSALDGSNVETLLTTELKMNLGRLALDWVGGRMYWTEADFDTEWGGVIRRSALDGASVETLVTGLQAPHDLALDVIRGQMYWTDWRAGTIQRSALDGSNVETLLTGVEGLATIALDPEVDWGGYYSAKPAAKPAYHIPIPDPATKMYWTEWNGESETGTIRRANLDGSNVETLLTGIGNPVGIAVLVDWGAMYWAEGDTGTIRRANLDGSNVETLATDVGGLGGFVLDPFYGVMYWTAWDTRTIRGAYIGGSNVEIIVTEVEQPLGIAVAPFAGTLYWTERDSNTIQRLDRSGQRAVVLGVEGPEGIAVDAAGGQLYWADKWTGAIRRANLDGTEVEALVSGVETPEDLALDLVGGHLYWTEWGPGTIRRADLDGANIETVTAVAGPKGIAVDAAGGQLYWTARVGSRFSDAGGIQRANLDGSNVATLVAGLGDPEGLALDLVGGHLYWIDGGVIQRADLDGANVEVLVTGLVRPVGIALDVVGGQLYWADKWTGVIQRADLDGANVEVLVSGLVRPVGIALDVTIPDAAPFTRTAVKATVRGGAVEDLSVEFARASFGRPPHYAYSATTDAAGRLELTISSTDRAGVSGYYQARARNGAGEVVGRWYSISLKQGRRQILELTLGGGVRVVASERLGEPTLDPCTNGVAVPDPQDHPGLVEDCRALLVFRDTRDWGSDLDWSAATLIAWWEGLQIRDFRVTGISFNPRDSPFIEGPIAPELGQLAELRGLNLADNALTGPIPPELGQLINLTELDLSDNGLTGPIPSELGRLTKLRGLNLSINQLTGPIPPELGQLTGLGFLNLSDNGLTGPIPSELGQLTGLWALYLYNNQLTGLIPPELGQLTGLWALYLYNNQLTGLIPPELGQLTGLLHLYLSDNGLTGPIPSELSQLTKLKILRLGHNPLTCVPEELAGWVDDLPVCSEGPSASDTVVEATILGAVVEDLSVEFARASFGRPPHYAYSATTDAAGRLELTISSADQAGVSGYYQARARNGAGEVVGRWYSISLKQGRRQILELTLGGGVRVVASKALDAAKEVATRDLPASSGLEPNVPNPFNASTQIAYRLSTPGPVRLEIYNTLGQPVRTLVDQVQAAGWYQIRWDARDQGGAAVATGVYLTRLHHPGGMQTRRLLLLK